MEKPIKAFSKRETIMKKTTLAFFLATTLWSGLAQAASLKICYKDIPTDTADINLYINAVKSSTVYPGQTQLDGSACYTIIPIPAAVVRGSSLSYTLKSSNSLGEEGPASNAITFRFPTVPGAATLMSVGAFVP